MSKTKKVVVALGVATALGIATLPLSTFAASSTSDITVKVKIGSVIALSADNQLTETNLNPNNVNTTALKTRLTVATNSRNGYKLTVKDKDANTNLASTETSDVIPALAGNLTAGTAGWNISGGELNKAAVTATDQVVKTNPNSTHASINEDIQMTYGVSTSASQAQGTYSDVIVYTATAL